MNIKDKLSSIQKNSKLKYAIILIIIVLIAWYVFQPAIIQTETSIVKKGIFEQIVEEDGMTRVKEKFVLFAPVSGILKRVNKRPGDSVTKGEIVAIVNWDFDRKIQSPITGKVLKLYRESEGPVNAGFQLMEIGDISNLEIASEILTRDAVNIRYGNQVIIEGWGGETLEGKVKIIEPSAYTKVSTLGVEEQRVKAIIDFNPPKEMGEGFQVHCKIITMKKENVLIVSSSALFRDGDDWAVFKVVNGKAIKAKIKLESRSGVNAIASQGLKENEEVILYPGEGIKDGVRVR